MAQMKHVYTIVERKGLEKNQWIRVGVAFVNRDQSLNIKLDAVPVNGQLHVRDPQKNGKAQPKGTVEKTSS
jgi:hypothetical protein